MAKKLEKEKKVSKAPKKPEAGVKLPSITKQLKKPTSTSLNKAKLKNEDKKLSASSAKEKISKPKEKAKVIQEKKKKKDGIESTKKEKKILNNPEDPSNQKKRGRKKKTNNENEIDSKKAEIIKLKSKKASLIQNKSPKALEEEEESFNEIEDLNLSFEDEIDVLTPVKRKPGRPAKPKDQASTKLIDFPSSVRLPKRQSTKPKKTLSQTIPGSGLAQLLASGDLNNFNEEHSTDEEIKTDIIDLQEEAQSLPSWTPRSWVTREGERLIIRGQELVKEEQFDNLDTEAPPGVISPDEVDEVIRRIRESYKKKSLPKKGNSISS